MARRAIVLSTKAALDAIVAALNTQLGYPNAGTPVGQGRHIQGPTSTHCVPFKHPTLASWAILVDAIADARIPAGTVRTNIDETVWIPKPAGLP